LADPNFDVLRHDVTFPLYVETLFFDYHRRHKLRVKIDPHGLKPILQNYINPQTSAIEPAITY
jgi:hypothetical protein